MDKDNLALDTFIIANKPVCPCKGGGTETITGHIKKVIKNTTGTWYYIQECSCTVNSEWITNL